MQSASWPARVSGDDIYSWAHRGVPQVVKGEPRLKGRHRRADPVLESTKKEPAAVAPHSADHGERHQCWPDRPLLTLGT